MVAVRVDDRSGGAGQLLEKAAAALLVLLLSACSTLQRELPEGSGGIRGSVFADDYALEIAALGSEQARSLSIAPPAGTALEGDVLRAPPLRGGYVPGQVLVHYRAGVDALSTLSRRGRTSAPRVVAVGPSEGMTAVLDRLARDPDVLLASPNYYVYPASLPDDPFLPQQWSLPAAGLPVTWDESTGELITVAVIDSGFDLEHEDLSGIFLSGFDFCSNSDCSATDADPHVSDPANWHGTHVAGIIAAVGDNGVGVKGVADGAAVRILPVKVFNDGGGSGNTEILIQAMRWAAGLPVEGVPANPTPARVLNLSLGGDFPSAILQPTIDEVRASGAIVIASTGNAGVNRVMSPAAADGVIGVGAINSAFERSCFSNYGVGANGPGGVDLVAPGGEADGAVVACGVGPYGTEGLMSTIPGSGYGSALGTSMSAPVVSGAAALILGQDPEMSVAEAESRLLDSAYFDPEYMVEAEYGSGVVRVDRALGYLGPGDRVLVELRAEVPAAARRLPLTLGLSAEGTGFSFEEIAPGDYELLATDPESGTPFTRLRLTLSPGQERQADLVLQDSP